MAETLSWAPKRAVFLRRMWFLATATFIALLSLGFVISRSFDLPVLWLVPTAALMTLGFLFEDLVSWRRVKQERWKIEDGHLLHEDADGSAMIPLSQIVQVKTQFGSRVILTLSSSQRLSLRHLPFHKLAAQQIRDAVPPPPPLQAATAGAEG